jgi:hypothetical protein
MNRLKKKGTDLFNMNRLHSPPHVVGYWVLYQHREVENVCQSNKSVGILYSFDNFARIQWPQAFQPDEPFYEAFYEAR